MGPMPIPKSSLIPGNAEASTLELGHAEKIQYRASTFESPNDRPGYYHAFEELVPSSQKSRREPFKKLSESLSAKLITPGGRLNVSLYNPEDTETPDDTDSKYHDLQKFLKNKLTTLHQVLKDSSAFLKQLVFTELKRPLTVAEEAEPSLDAEPAPRLCLLPPPCGAHLAHSVANCLRLWQAHLGTLHLDCKQILFAHEGDHAFYPQSVKSNFEKLEGRWERAKGAERRAHEEED